MATPAKNFENSIKQLEKIIDEIENDELNIELALERYKQGVELVNFCQSKLIEIEQKIKLLDRDSNTLKDINIE